MPAGRFGIASPAFWVRRHRVARERDTLIIVPKVISTLFALALTACSAAPPPEPATGSFQQANPSQPESNAPASPAEPPPQTEVEPPREPPETAEPVGLVETTDGATGGVACTVTDSNGPETGGDRTDTCPEGQFCVCDRAGGYSCAGTCQRAAEAAPKNEGTRSCPCPALRNRFGEFAGGTCGTRACAANGQLLLCRDDGWVGLKAKCTRR